MYFTFERIRRILQELRGYIYTESQPIKVYDMKQCGYGDFNLLNDTTGWSEFVSGKNRWGGRDKHFWFKTSFSAPQSMDGKCLTFEVKTGREGGWDALNPQFFVYINGKPVQGLDVNHREVLLTDNAKTNDKYALALYAYAGMDDNPMDLFTNIKVLDKNAENLYYNIRVPLEVAELLDKDDLKSINIQRYLTDAVNMLDLRKPFSQDFNKSVNAANDYLNTEFYGRYCGNEDVIELCVGHTHIDVAWLWTLAQTREKAARSFSTVLNLMKQYPDYVFMSSQPQLYKFIKEDHPEIFEEIKKMVKQGRWEPEGAMWLEADCNLSSGESLVRQIIFGKNFFKKEFGVDNKILWLPDVFGYSAALPQILKKSGVDYFMTTKISWNEYNKLPYDTFMWKGIDGTEVLSHFITTKDYDKDHKKDNWFTTYNGFINPKQVMGNWQRYQQKNINNEVLNCFGYGDGGGGPTKEMLENAKRLEKGIPGCPKVKMGTSLDYFKRLDKKVSNNKYLPKWVGELYLEYHRGTYTTMARNKKYNRKTEFLNLASEFLSMMDTTLNGTAYPQDIINSNWETTLKNQFHDIIPGSSIKEVYEDSKKDYERIDAAGNEIAIKALNNISANIKLNETSVVVFNQLSFDRSDIAIFDLPSGWTNTEVYDVNTLIDSQLVEGNKIIFFAKSVPSKGYKTFKLLSCDKKQITNTLNITKEGFTNKFFDVKFDKNGDIVSLNDLINNRQVLKPNTKANELLAFEDKPHNFDAWDINIYYQEKMWKVDDIESIEVIEKGPVRAAIKIKRKFLDSSIDQTIYAYKDIPRIDFATHIDWKEKQILLKSSFPVDIHSDKATYEIQYGNVERPTHWNTSWDYARFEVCAHKWADLSEGNYGVSLMNDCKYGHDIKESVMRLTLLKSPTNPNEDADREIHEFIYSLYPHSGNWKQAGTVNMAYSINCPFYVKVEEAHNGKLPEALSFVSVNKDNVIIEVIKKSENDDDTIIRLYESQNIRTKVNVMLYKDIAKVNECDLLENNILTISPSGNSFDFEIKPYEIKTFKIKLNK